MKAPQLVIFGGTFDPPHNGHLLCVELALLKFPAAQLLICPTYAPLFDTRIIPKKTLFDFATRLRLVRKTFTDARVSVSDLEKEMPRPNLTVNLLAALNTPKQERMALLIGQDQFSSFKDWQRVEEMTAVCDLIVARRSGSPPLDQAMATLAAQLGVEMLWQEEKQCYISSLFSVYILADRLLDASSTEIRTRYQNGEDVGQVVPAVVINFLHGQGDPR